MKGATGCYDPKIALPALILRGRELNACVAKHRSMRPSVLPFWWLGGAHWAENLRALVLLGCHVVFFDLLGVIGGVR